MLTLSENGSNEIRPRFKAGVQCDLVGDSTLIFECAGQIYVVEGTVYADLVPILDGSHTIGELIGALGGRHDPMKIFHALDQLRSRQLLLDTPPSGLSRDASAYWESVGVDPFAAEQRLASFSTTISSPGDVLSGMAADLQTALVANGLCVQPGGQSVIHLVRDYSHAELSLALSAMRDDRRSVLVIRSVDDTVLVGPLFLPGKPGCPQCLVSRVSAHQKLGRFQDVANGRMMRLRDGHAALPSQLMAATGLLATEISRYVAAGTLEDLHNMIKQRDIATGCETRHTVIPVPDCAVCGTGSSKTMPPPFRLEQRTVGFSADGGHRFLPPEKTVAKLKSLISPLSGIVSHFERVEDPEDDAGLVHCYVADHAFTPMNGRLDRLREGREGRSGGKGRSDIQAQASALSEGVERYSGVFQKSDPTINARAEELDGPAILPNSIQNFSARQIKNRSVEEAEAGGAGWVAEEFDAGKSIDWTPLWSLTEERIKYLPTANCFYGYGLQRDLHFARADSNGCAAGNTREEAVLQGFLELVERDAVALWWYNRLKRPGVDLDSFNDPWFGRIQQHYHGRGREIWLLDLTADMGIPTFAAISRVIDHQPEHLLFGYGCHFDVRLAASRAVTEVNQALALFPKKTPDSAAQASMTRKGFEWWPVATVADHPYLQPDLLAAPCRAVDFGANTGKDLHDDVTDCIARAKARGLEVLVLDQTRADTGLNVVRVVVPGLRHFWPRLAPGRLYDVPVQMGWLDQPNAESDLNPAHFFL